MFAVNLFVAGFNKCGSTTLSALLGRHPDILMPAQEEPWYFVKDDSQMTWQQYVGQFPGWQTRAIVCDDSAGAYTSHPPERPGIEAAVQRIHEHNPAAKFLFIARDPARRIESAFRELHATGIRYGIVTPFELGEAMVQSPQLAADSCYADSLALYREAFGSEQLHLVYLEDLVAAPVATMRKVWDFLGIDPEAVAVEPLPRANDGVAKLGDTRLLRRIRRSRRLGPHLARIPATEQDRWLTKVGLRRPMPADVRWDTGAREVVANRIWPDALALWRTYGEPVDGWPYLRDMAADRALV